MTDRFNNSHLTTHEAILDCLLRFVQGLDDNNATLVESAFISDAVFDLSALKFQGDHYGETHGRDKIVDQLLTHVGPLDSTHMCSNIRTNVSVDGKRAHLTAYALAQHWRPGHGLSTSLGKDYLMGNRYKADLVLVEDEWRFERFELYPSWMKGDPSVLESKSWQPVNELIRKLIVPKEKEIPNQ